MVDDACCPGVGHASDDTFLTGSSCAKRYAAGSIRNEFGSKLEMAMKENGQGEEWDPVRRVGSPCPMLEHALIDLLRDIHAFARAGGQLSGREDFADPRYRLIFLGCLFDE